MDERTLSDRYRLVAHLARGGMADVYEAEDTMLNRRVAIKILHTNFAADEAFVTRFRREAQAAANLSHPNI
ncbi:MAG: serine/threonine protein kinase, partial [Actinobacteria bacterium]|nr:serine/threonine protein kinase [Actinomycetota bacterium]